MPTCCLLHLRTVWAQLQTSIYSLLLTTYMGSLFYTNSLCHILKRKRGGQWHEHITGFTGARDTKDFYRLYGFLLPHLRGLRDPVPTQWLRFLSGKKNSGLPSRIGTSAHYHHANWCQMLLVLLSDRYTHPPRGRGISYVYGVCSGWITT